MAYQHARSGICRSGTAISGLVPYRLRCTIAGVERGIQIGSLSITHTLGQASSCALQVQGFQVRNGQEVQISDDGVSNLLFGGTVMRRQRRIQRGEPVYTNVLCNDWSWLMNKEERVFDNFYDLSANVALYRVLQHCPAALGMRVGYAPHSLGKVTLAFNGETITDAIGKIASACNAYWKWNPGKTVDIFQSEVPHGETLILNDSTGIRNLIIEDFFDQLRNRVWYAGGGAQTSGFTSAGSSTIQVKECGWYDVTGGFILTDSGPIVYGSKSIDSGLGLLTGVVSLKDDIVDGTTIPLFIKKDDAARQSALATLLGGGFSGVSIYYASDARVSTPEGSARSLQHIGFYGDELHSVTGTIDDYDEDVMEHVYNASAFEVGRMVNFDVEDENGEETTGTFRLAQIVIQFMGDVPKPGTGNQGLQLERNIMLRPGIRQGIMDLLVNS